MLIALLVLVHIYVHSSGFQTVQVLIATYQFNTGIQLSDVQLVYLIKILRLKKFDALSYSLSVFNKVVYKSLTGVELDEQLKEL